MDRSTAPLTRAVPCAAVLAICAQALAACGGRSGLPDLDPAAIVCPPEAADCNDDPSDGCEADLSSSVENCGACGAGCAAGLVCGASQCVPPDFIVELDTGGGARVARNARGDVFGWGSNSWLMIADDGGKPVPGLPNEILVPTLVPGFPLAAEVAMDRARLCIRSFDGDVYCRGANAGAIPGAGTDEQLVGAYKIPGVTGAVRLQGGVNGFCAAEALGAWKCWGAILDHNMLAIGSGHDVRWPLLAPVELQLLPDGLAWLQPSLAVTGDGSVLTWGDPEYSGYPAPLTPEWGSAGSSPIRHVPGLGGVVRVDAGWDSYCATGATGRVVCWGGGLDNVGAERNQFGHFVAFREGPYKRVAVGRYDICALDFGGDVSCFDERNKEDETSGASDIIAAEGGDVVCVIRGPDARVFCIGNGSLGDGNLVPPVDDEYIEALIPRAGE